MSSVDLALKHQDLMAKREDLRVTLVTCDQQQIKTSDQESEQVRQHSFHGWSPQPSTAL